MARRWKMVSQDAPMKLEEFEPAAPSADEVIVQIAGCGVCHTDLGYYYDGVRTNQPLPLTLGHEISGMRERGQVWLDMAARLEQPKAVVAAEKRPAPSPPDHAHPRRLSVTRIRTLVRDPYAIYAQYVLGLRKLDPIRMWQA